jgi:hypothetical protein
VKRLVARQGWKVLLIPLFFDVPPGVKYACAAVVAASLVWDLARLRREQTKRIHKGSS